jgi:hypothetical protein
MLPLGWGDVTGVVAWGAGCVRVVIAIWSSLAVKLTCLARLPLKCVHDHCRLCYYYPYGVPDGGAPSRTHPGMLRAVRFAVRDCEEKAGPVHDFAAIRAVMFVEQPVQASGAALVAAAMVPWETAVRVGPGRDC